MKTPEPRKDSNPGQGAYLSLTTFHDDEFLLRGGSGEDNFGVVLQHAVQLLRAHVFQLAAVHDAGLGVPAEEKRGQLRRRGMGTQAKLPQIFLREK